MPASSPTPFDVATVTLNPAIDRTIEVPGFALGAVNRATHLGDRAGGKGINVAAALAADGHRTVALGFLGRDNAAVFETFLAVHGIQDALLRMPGETRTGLKIVDPVRNETTDLNFPGLPPTVEDLAALTRQLDTIQTCWCVLAGSLPPGVPVDFYREAITRLKVRGVRVGLDASGAPLREAIEAGPDFIKPNVHELSDLVGHALPDRTAIVAAARTLNARGIPLVVVSCGAEGAVFVSDAEIVHARPPAITVGSTVGAGDAMVAGIVAAQLRGLSLMETARHATACSIRALSRGETDRDAAPDLTILGATVSISAS
jgi:1-phosphofructokinase